MIILSIIKCCALAVLAYPFTRSTIESLIMFIRWGYDASNFISEGFFTSLLIANLICSILTVIAELRYTYPKRKTMILSIVFSVLSLVLVTVRGGALPIGIFILILFIVVSVFELLSYSPTHSAKARDALKTISIQVVSIANSKVHKTSPRKSTIAQNEFDEPKSNIRRNEAIYMNNTKKILSILKLIILIVAFFVGIRTLFITAEFFFADMGLFLIEFAISITMLAAYGCNIFMCFMNLKHESQNTEPPANNIIISTACSVVCFVLFIYYYIYYFEFDYVYFLIFEINCILFAFLHFAVVGISIYELIEYDIINLGKKNVSSPTSTPNLNKLVEYKELLDIGAITQEEYDKMKKEILSNK